ncbi:hypothetical protein M408DRAFT_28858 [Serendipita vermifera MAFF 305830]|uniref:BRCT domain-containing protein n=1 Tax=Serendipita vermifera MAFF 305830 TaxID=933852 RepID=A0A0C3AC49_SERVB|nr:hypothetical protein M408DRAFT_28858 [Serendipita vermifera MAFF 305830]
MAAQVTSTRQPGAAPPLFSDLRYYIASCVPISHQTGMRKILDSHGAIEYVFTDSDDFEGANEVQKGTAVVLPLWIERSLANKTLQDARHFSASPSDIFSTLVIATDHLPPGDVETIIAGTRAKGGMYRDGLTRDVTHLLVLSPTGDKYRTARRHAAQTGIKIVLVHWFDDCFKVEHRLPEAPYEEPLLQAEQELRQQAGGEERLKSDVPIKPSKIRLPERAQSFYDALKKASTPPPDGSPSKSIGSIRPQLGVWDERRILLSHSLMLSKDRRATVIREIKRCGGDVIPVDYGKSKAREYRDSDIDATDEPDSDAEMTEHLQFEIQFANGGLQGRKDLKLSPRYRDMDAYEALLVMQGKVDVLVTKYRSGLAYLAALYGLNDKRREVTIGTLPWVFYVQYSGAISSPKSQLLHFPVRRGAVPDIKGKTITVTNYQGPARDYLKKLINIMAGPRSETDPEVFSATLSKQTSMVIASRLEGKKVESAQSWRIPIVNHLWLEDTLKAWKGANLAEPRYTHWRSKITYGDLLPGSSVVDANDPDLKIDAEQVAQEMKAIGYDSKRIQAAMIGDMGAFLDGKGLRHWRAVVHEETTSSHAEVEASLRVNETVMEIDVAIDEDIPETSPVRARTSDRPSSVMVTRTRYDSPSGRTLVPVITRPRSDSAPGRGDMGGGNITSLTAMTSKKDKRALSQQTPSNNPQPAPEATFELPSTQPSKTGASASTAPLLRSPWDPSPTKVSSGVVTNDSPVEFRRPGRKRRVHQDKPAKVHRAKQAPVTVRDADEDEEDARPKASKRSTAKHRAHEVAQPDDSSAEDEPTIRHREAKQDDTRRESNGKGKKRNIQTQESDEEFRVETQDDLISRRRKVVNATENQGPLGIDISPDTFARNGHVYPRRSMRKEEDASDSEQQERKGKKPITSKADKAIKRLRNSISGKEDADTTKGGKGKGKAETRKRTVPANTDDSEIEDVSEPEPQPQIKKRAAVKGKGKGKPKKSETASITPALSENEHAAAPSTSSRPSSSQLSSEEEETQNPRPRRGAATKATQVLKEKIMPDANRFAQEMKVGDVRNDWEENKKRRRDSEVEESEHTPEIKKRKKIDKGTTAKKDRDASHPVPDPEVRMLTTRVVISDKDLNKLHDMGIQQVQDPLSCTHLVSNAIMRTEKFISAIAVCPIIVTEKWVRECLRAKRIVDTAPYLLHDREGEEKFKFSLKACLDQARETGTTLFEGHTFYLVFGPDASDVLIGTLTSAVKSAGGKVSRQTPSLRQMEDHIEKRHVVSDFSEEKRWKALFQKKIPIYSQELIITSILQQRMPDWHDPRVVLRFPPA